MKKILIAYILCFTSAWAISPSETVSNYLQCIRDGDANAAFEQVAIHQNIPETEYIKIKQGIASLIDYSQKSKIDVGLVGEKEIDDLAVVLLVEKGITKPDPIYLVKIRNEWRIVSGRDACLRIYPQKTEAMAKIGEWYTARKIEIIKERG